MGTASELAPSSGPVAGRVEVAEAVLGEVERRYQAGRYLDAYRAALESGPLAAWRGIDARILAGRLAGRLGGTRLSRLLIATAFRERPRHAGAVLYRAYDLLSLRGPLAVWEFTAGWDALEGLTAAAAGGLLALRARLAGLFRDFELADRLMVQALERCPESPWVLSEQAGLLRAEERFPDAERACGRSLELAPWFRPAVQERAALLMRRLRYREAAAWLEQACAQMQSCEVINQLIGLKRQQDDSGGMAALLDAFEAHAPLLERSGRQWLAECRCEAHCLAGEWADAAAQARLAGGSYYADLASRLDREPPARRRMRLPLPQVLQRHNTCGPSTLAMLAGFWGLDASAEAIADAICYEGTSDQAAREWCLGQGLAVREFRVTWESARTLLEAGLPFALATVEVGSAHLQAVMGCDEARRTFLIQDPATFLYREVAAAPFLEEYALFGPRGMVVAPPALEQHMRRLELPDTDLYDHMFAFSQALAAHHRDQAEAILAGAAREAPGHRVHGRMRWALAAYDNDSAGELEVLAELEAQFPGDPRLVARRAWLLREHGPRAELAAMLRAAVSAPRTHPAIWREYIAELSGDARRDEEAWKWLRRAHAAMPLDPGILEAWGDRWWAQGRTGPALEALGFAGSLAPADERLARLWFDASRAAGRRAEALERLHRRHRALGDRSAQPGRTLLWALEAANQGGRARVLLAELLRRHPQDGPLLLDAAGFSAQRGDLDAARRHLDAARARTPRGRWLRAAAALHDRAWDFPAALDAWQELLRREPTAVDAHGAAARLLAVLQGNAAALAHLDRAAARFPHHSGLQRLRLDWLRETAPQLAEEAVRRLLELHPGNAWALREMALVLAGRGRAADAWEAAVQAAALEPRSPHSHGVLAIALKAAARIPEAREQCREALRLDVDYAAAQVELVGLARDLGERRRDLDFIRAEMERQVLDGSSLQTYLELASPVLEPGVLLAQLREIHAVRPDLHAAWSALVRHLLETGAVDQACALATEAAGRFSRRAAAWLDAARAYRAAPLWEKAVQYAATAADLDPAWAEPWSAWAGFLEDWGRLDQALEVLKRAARRLPGVSAFPVSTARILWRLGRREPAFEAVLAALTRFPGDSGAWILAGRWAETLGRGERILEAARRITRDRPGEARSWMILARCLDRSAMDEKLQACDRALALDPLLVEARDQKAALLASLGRFQEAADTCRPDLAPGQDSHFLEGRLAWLDWQQGRRAGALERMEAVLARHPDYPWGWEQVLEWAGAARDPDRERRARTALDRLAPNSPTALCRAGAAAVKAGRWSEAAPLFRRALELDPGSPYPLHQWLGICWGRRDTAAIREAARAAPPGLTQALAEAYLVLADTFEGRRGDAERGLARLVRSPEPLGPALADLSGGLRALGWEKAWNRALDQAADAGQIGMAFAPAWVETQAAAGRWSAWKRFEDWIRRGHEDAAPALAAYFDLLGRHRKARAAMGFFRSPGAEWVRRRTPLLGKAGYALAQSAQWSMTAAWLEGADRRQDAEGWIASNLVLALDRLGREPQATAVAWRTVERGLRDHAWPNLVAQLAFGEALRGDPARTREVLGLADPPGGDTPWRWKRLLAEQLAQVLEAGPDQARDSQRRAIRELRAAARRGFRQVDPGMIRNHRLALERMARHSGVPVRPWNRFTALPVRRVLQLAGRILTGRWTGRG